MLALYSGTTPMVYEEVQTSFSRGATERATGPKDLKTSVLADPEMKEPGATTVPQAPNGKKGKMATSGTGSEVAGPAQKTESGKHSPAYAEFVLREQVSVMGPFLVGLRGTLDQPEGARHMVGFREAFAHMWEVRDGLPKETVLLLSAIEETIREKKWRQLIPSQVDVLSSTVAQLRGRGFSEKHLRESLRSMQRNWLDVFPSADDDYEHLEDAEEEA